MSGPPPDEWAASAGGDIYTTPHPVDLFQGNPVPAFPLDALPEPMQIFATEYAAQSGFDPGAYGFCLLIEAANLIDHRTRLKITETWSVPAFQWAAVVDRSGGGKSPVMDACAKCSWPVYQEIDVDSAREYAKWVEAADACGKGEKPPPKPQWRQRHTENTTVEGLADLAAATPEGVNMRIDEMSEWVGRMDAYHKGGGAQDRANYLKAYNSNPTTITRQNRKLIIENWSVGILAGVQPERLANLFKRSGDASDGLFQRVMLYVFQPTGEADFSARVGRFTDMNAANLYRQIERLSDDGPKFALEHPARLMMQEYVNAMRKVATRTASVRLREHINKFQGFLGRLTLALHLIDAAATQTEPAPEVPTTTLERAKRILACLYRHSEAVYAEIDGQAHETTGLARTAAEAILAKRWDAFNRGDLTKHATHWRSSDHYATEGAIDLLIELGWVIDVTEPSPPGKRGRRSAGKFVVPPITHVLFQQHAERIRREREERRQAIEQVAEIRRNELVE